MASQQNTDFNGYIHLLLIGKMFVQAYPESGLFLIEDILENFGNEDSVVFPNSSAISVLTEIVKNLPNESWNHIKKYLGPPTTSRSFWIEKWLRGDDYFKDTPALDYFKTEDIWKWIEEDKVNRAPYVASFIPKTPFKSDNQIRPRELLVRHGSDKQVWKKLIMNLDTGMISETTKEKKERFLEIKKEGENPLVNSFIDEYIGIIDTERKFLENWEERDYSE